MSALGWDWPDDEPFPLADARTLATIGQMARQFGPRCQHPSTPLFDPDRPCSTWEPDPENRDVDGTLHVAYDGEPFCLCGWSRRAHERPFPCRHLECADDDGHVDVCLDDVEMYP